MKNDVIRLRLEPMDNSHEIEFARLAKIVSAIEELADRTVGSLYRSLSLDEAERRPSERARLILIAEPRRGSIDIYLSLLISHLDVVELTPILLPWLSERDHREAVVDAATVGSFVVAMLMGFWTVSAHLNRDAQVADLVPEDDEVTIDMAIQQISPAELEMYVSAVGRAARASGCASVTLTYRSREIELTTTVEPSFRPRSAKAKN